jgi:hypothetical protein
MKHDRLGCCDARGGPASVVPAFLVELVDPHRYRCGFGFVGGLDDASDGDDETFDGDAGVEGNGDRPLALQLAHGLGETS